MGCVPWQLSSVARHSLSSRCKFACMVFFSCITAFILPLIVRNHFLGCGKTTLVQRLAKLTGRSLLVQNLSLQTDSTDLLGGYKPLEMKHVARGVFDKFVDLFCASFSRSQNAQFLKYVLTAFEKGDWKKLAQCFLRAASMGENKASWPMQVLSKHS